MGNRYYVYIMTNWCNTVLYTGMTNNLERRVYEHKNKTFDGFSSKYNTNKLVYYDCTNDVNAAIEKEKQIKGWTRKRKAEMVTQNNPNWMDLSEDWTD